MYCTGTGGGEFGGRARRVDGDGSRGAKSRKEARLLGMWKSGSIGSDYNVKF
jgi:hypothetical protein